MGRLLPEIPVNVACGLPLAEPECQTSNFFQSAEMFPDVSCRASVVNFRLRGQKPRHPARDAHDTFFMEAFFKAVL